VALQATASASAGPAGTVFNLLELSFQVLNVVEALLSCLLVLVKELVEHFG
jgi:hypothetical protein